MAAKASTASSPAAAASQNARGGRSPARATAHAAVAAGSSPTTTLACAADVCWSASDVKIGNPTTTPSPTSANRGRSRRAGIASRRDASRTAASAAATSARPRPTNVGSRSSTASRVRAARIVEDLYVPGPLQEAALDLVGTPAWRAHLKRLRRTLRERRDALASALGELRPWRLPEGGMNLWVPLPPGTDDRELTQRAAAAGVVVSPGRPFFVAEPPGPFLRLTFAAEPPDRLAEAVRRLTAAL